MRIYSSFLASNVLRRLHALPARPTNPVPSKIIVAGSGIAFGGSAPAGRLIKAKFSDKASETVPVVSDKVLKPGVTNDVTSKFLMSHKALPPMSAPDDSTGQVPTRSLPHCLLSLSDWSKLLACCIVFRQRATPNMQQKVRWHEYQHQDIWCAPHCAALL